MAPPDGWKKPKVKLIGQNGNAFVILGLALRAIRGTKVSNAEEMCKQYMAEAKSGDYDHLLVVTTEWCEVE